MSIPISLLKNKFFLVLFFITIIQSAQAQLRINEILCANSSIVYDKDFGEFSDYIELYNASPSGINLKNYTVTDNPGNKRKWTLPEIILPSNRYLLIWADGRNTYPGNTDYSEVLKTTITVTELHTNFNLSAEGEYVGVFDDKEKLVDEITFNIQENDISYGRNPGDSTQWIYFSEPTPNLKNSDFGSALLDFSAEPQFSLNEGFYPSQQTLQISTSAPDAVIRFTMDGSTPTIKSPVFNNSFEILRNYSIKARVYENGKLPGKVVTKSYFINEKFSLPVISISTDHPNFYDYDFGILQNAIKEREVPAFIEYFSASGKREFNTGIGVKIFGSTTYNLPQRPISIRFKEKYGVDVLKFKLFEDKANENYSSFLLRNGGNDYNLAYFRDGLAVNLMKNKMDIDYQEHEPCVVFINGQYNGIYEIRERLDEDYISKNHQVNMSNLDYLEDSLQVNSGSRYDYEKLQKFIDENSLSDTANFRYISSKIDINEYINYMIHKIFIGYWIVNHNNKYWKDNDTDSRWRWIAHDMEHSFGQLSGDNYMDNTLHKVAGGSDKLPEWSTVLFKNLLKNKTFRDEFIQRTSVYLNTIYLPSVTIPVLDSIHKKFNDEMPRHISRWTTPSSVSIWEGNIDFIKLFLQNRSQYLREHLSTEFNVQDSVSVELRIEGKGEVLFSGALMSDTFNSGFYFKDIPVSLFAVPKPGYRFVKWEGLNNNINNAETTLIPSADISIKAVFEPSQMSIIPASISKDTTLSAALSPWYGIEDVTIRPGARLTVEEGVEINMTDKVSIYVEGGLSIEGSEDKKVIIRSDDTPTARKPFYNSTGRWGSIIANNSTDTISIKHAVITGASKGRDRVKNFSAISVYNSPLHVSHSSISEVGAPLFAEGGSVYIGYSNFHTYGQCNGYISIYKVDDPIVEHNVFKGNRAIDTDAIDIKSVRNGIINNNHIYGFVGSNCDGIDLGIYSTNILIQNNLIHDCTDKGISIGSQSNATIRHNVIYDCDMGIGVKDSLSIANIDQNSFYGNNYAVSCYEKSFQRGGGTAYVKNTILAGSLKSTIHADAKSLVEVSYSLSDKELLDGENNIFKDPKFKQPVVANFQLQDDSPCIDKGDPMSALDGDGTRADIGAYYIHSFTSDFTLRINEVNYNSAINYNSGDWIEIFNQSKEPVDLSNYKIKQGSNNFTFRANSIIAPGDFLVICEDTVLFKTLHPEVRNFTGEMHFELDNDAGKIALYDFSDNLIYNVRYADYWPWPSLADGKGATMELDQNKEGNKPSEWRESYLRSGTPGNENSVPADVTGLFINEITAINTLGYQDENNEYDDWFEVFNNSNDSIDIGGLYFTDNSDMPHKWQAPLNFPEITNIPPKGYKLIWADEQGSQGPLHANFKLSTSGEFLGLFQRVSEDFKVLDSLTFPKQTAGISFGRFPDGEAELDFLQPTPESGNVVTGIMDATQLKSLNLYPNPFSTSLIVETESLSMPYNFTIIDALGTEVWKSKMVEEKPLVVKREQLPSTGMFTILITDQKGNIYLGKVLAY